MWLLAFSLFVLEMADLAVLLAVLAMLDRQHLVESETRWAVHEQLVYYTQSLACAQAVGSALDTADESSVEKSVPVVEA